MTNNGRRTQLITVDGRSVCFHQLLPCRGEDAASAGLPLLLIHGLGCSCEAWGPLLRCLERHGVEQSVYAPDMPGYGSSPGPPEALGIDALADWCARLLDTLTVPRAHLAGNSMG